MVSRKYTNFVSFCSRETSNACLPGKINVNLRSKIRDANKCDEHSSKLVRKSPHTYSTKCYFKINLKNLIKKEICKRRFGFVY